MIEPRDGTFSALLKFSGPHHMHVSHNMIDQIKGAEKLRLHPYDNDGSGTTTIGYGHRLHSGLITKADLEKFKHGITEAAANDLLREDLSIAERPIDDRVGVPLTQHQFDALVSLVLNIGITAFRDSTLLKMLNGGSGQHTGDYLGAARQFSAWHKVARHGVLRSSKDLIKRRAAEEALFLRR